MPSTAAAHLVIRKNRARERIAAEVRGVEMETGTDGTVVIRNAEDGTWVATLEEVGSDEGRGDGDPVTKLEYLDAEGGKDARLARRVRSVLSKYKVR